ncbi:hypothetical protein Q664_16615 [Archangium violaceum Cb vi76]|uniref:CHAT domain-containing protein n=1 Tax=Archangium violaceum Cb vi76 TaxID=1406225 RepID=A0A084SUV6_9BACT|nr:hypothetical protein Q664_16615 [Archangium violaceum Cb vi76]
MASAALIIWGCAACTTLENTPVDAGLVEAEQAFDEGRRLEEAGRYVDAMPLIERALKLREAAHGESHLEVASCLHLLGVIHLKRGDHGRAEQYLQRAFAIREAALGGGHPDNAASMSSLADLHMSLGRFERAEPLYGRALAIRESVLGKNHPDVAAALNDLAEVYASMGHYARAEPLYARALEIQESVLGKSHPDIANSLSSLARLYVRQGDYARAEPLFERAHAISEAALGENHPDVARSLHNLANIYLEQEKSDKAEPLYERAIAIRRASLGENHPLVASSLNNLAILYKWKDDYVRARQLYERALEIRELSLGKNHPDVAPSLQNLANLSMRLGDYTRAEPLYERALEIREATLSQNHPDIAQSLNDLARVHLAKRNLAEALPLLERAFALQEGHLRQESFGFSEARLSSVLDHLRSGEEYLYALVRAYPNNAHAQRLALSAALLRKGRSVEEVAHTSRIIYRGLGQADREAYERLRTLRTQLAELSLARPGSLSSGDHQQRIQELTRQGDALEADLARRSAPLRALFELPPPGVLVERVAKALPGDGALVEFVSYEDSPLVPRPGSSHTETPSEPRYLALLLFADGRTEAIDLGPAAPIDRAVQRLHEAIEHRYVSYQSRARALHALVFRPLMPSIGKVRRLFLSPDGQLALVPFAALHDGRQFLADGIDITYLTSGKDLLPRFEGISPVQSVVVLADPAFGPVPDSSSAKNEGDPSTTERSAFIERFFPILRSEAVDRPWPPLPGTRQEAEAIQRMLPQAQVLMGPAATKAALLRLATPGVLHIATHGFVGEGNAPNVTRAVHSFGAAGEASPSHLPADPLLRSGLVLASSARFRREDSLVTALELAGLDLWGTQLVVLSACDTGRGDIKPGQGVYGLRRALMVAGAQTLVTSLWKVNDKTTHQLMENYYGHLLAGQGRGAALRSAMRELRQKKPHPYYWAPFIAIGQDKPLQGLVPSAGVRSTP